MFYEVTDKVQAIEIVHEDVEFFGWVFVCSRHSMIALRYALCIFG